jgi:Domain of unknown function DUF29
MTVDRTYDGDLALWSADQARALRRAARTRTNLPIDWENVAEEIESLGKSQARELASRIETILLHLIKLQASPAGHPRTGWRATIQRQRDEIESVLADSPSLRRSVPAVIEAKIGKARRLAALDLADFTETPQVEPDSLGYSAAQVLGDWFPG